MPSKKIRYEEPAKIQEKTAEIIFEADRIITDFRGQGYDLTVRQLFYQFVGTQPLSKPFENSEKNYKKLVTIVSNGRLWGMLDWDAVVNRTRSLDGNSHWENPRHLIQWASEGFAINKWEDQSLHVEVWVEKDALKGVVGRVCAELDLDHFSCRGYPSLTSMWEASQRLREQREKGKKNVILHLGDHDPSGLDMSRDIQDRLLTFGVPIELRRIALNRDQVDALGLVPNPTKLTDSRAADYIRQHGHESWELDALDPSFISDLIRNEVASLRDDGLYSQRQDIEDQYRGELAVMINGFEEGLN
jgi:hypothetical protein